MNKKQIIELARKLRKNQTNAEKILWAVLRNRQLDGKKFVRQHPLIYENRNNDLSFYIPDFYCAEHKLVVELDGKIHDFQMEYDEQRTLIINSMGINVLRIKNEELGNIEIVKEKIRQFF
jgi:very-short-patch-repair endonuclease